MDTAVDRLSHPALFNLLRLAYRVPKHRHHVALVRPVLDGRLGYRGAPRLRRHNVSHFVRASICIGRFSPAMRRAALDQLLECFEPGLLRDREWPSFEPAWDPPICRLADPVFAPRTVRHSFRPSLRCISALGEKIGCGKHLRRKLTSGRAVSSPSSSSSPS